MKEYLANYVGICIQNDDPEKRGRVKIFVPHISATVYNGWNKDKKDKNFRFLGEDNPDISAITEDLKAVLPWAECAAPVFGGSASGRYNAYTNTGTTSDSNVWENSKLSDGNRALQNHIAENSVPDVFSSNDIETHIKNTYSYQYTPSNYSNLARGMFTIPNVGAHLWVFFREGNPNCPVYFAACHGEEDWKRIYTSSQEKEEDGSVDYPASYENVTKGEAVSFNSDVSTFRAKTVLNSNKHTIELVDTDNREILKMTHFSGSFKEFNNYANIELASGNDQKMVMGDMFLNVRKNNGIYVAMTQEEIIGGDRYTKIGSGEENTVQQIVDILKEIHQYKMLFDVMRTDESKAEQVNVPLVMSIHQRIQPVAGAIGDGFDICPICKNQPYVPNYVGVQPDEALGDPGVDPNTIAPGIGDIGFVFGAICDTCRGSGFSPSTQDGFWKIDNTKEVMISNLLKEKASDLARLERRLGEGDNIVQITKNKVETIGLVMNDMTSYRVDPIGKSRVRGVVVAPESVYQTQTTSPHVEYVDVDDVPGGDYNLTCTNKFKLLVGAKGVNIKTYGPIDIYGTIVNMVGEQVNISSPQEVFIDGGERFSIRSRIISLHPFEHAPVSIDGQLHVHRNMVVGGGAMINGELGVNHITAPYDYMVTEMPYPNAILLTLPHTDNQGVGAHTHQVPEHRHYYKHISSTLVNSPDGVRDTMIGNGINELGSLIAAAPTSQVGTEMSEIWTRMSEEDRLKYIIEPARDYVHIEHGISYGNIATEAHENNVLEVPDRKDDTTEVMFKFKLAYNRSSSNFVLANFEVTVEFRGESEEPQRTLDVNEM